ncbi:mitochondrial 2-oxoglutarate/malate carrier protein-like [Zophobas morio]|uniref:mitochondrial 2-oxoglutarate/malate carrier protein-like n=1 Tax=Zophobas morio TaxID=2755281 RepID=UPI003083D356
MTGVASGACAALISCPAEVALVRMSNDSSLPSGDQRKYRHIIDCATRIWREEGVRTFWRGSLPFVNRAMVVGVCQVGTYDQFLSIFSKLDILNPTSVVAFSAMSAGLIYSTLTMPLETAKNRMAFQKPDPRDGEVVYKKTFQTIKRIATTEGPLSLWNGFLPYFGRCGGSKKQYDFTFVI